MICIQTSSQQLVSCGERQNLIPMLKTSNSLQLFHTATTFSVEYALSSDVSKLPWKVDRDVVVPD